MIKPSQTALEAARRIYIAIEDDKVISTAMLASIIDDAYAPLLDAADHTGHGKTCCCLSCVVVRRATPGGDDGNR